MKIYKAARRSWKVEIKKNKINRTEQTFFLAT